MGSRRECTRILGLEGFRVATIEWERGVSRVRMQIRVEPCGIRGYRRSGCLHPRLMPSGL
jgi:hypothetical protein